MADLCFDFSMTEPQIRALAKKHNFGERPEIAMTAKVKRCPEPTEQEVAQRVAQVQSGWSDEVRLARFMGKKRVNYVAPEYSTDELRSYGLND